MAQVNWDFLTPESATNPGKPLGWTLSPSTGGVGADLSGGAEVMPHFDNGDSGPVTRALESFTGKWFTTLQTAVTYLTSAMISLVNFSSGTAGVEDFASGWNNWPYSFELGSLDVNILQFDTGSTASDQETFIDWGADNDKYYPPAVGAQIIFTGAVDREAFDVAWFTYPSMTKATITFSGTGGNVFELFLTGATGWSRVML